MIKIESFDLLQSSGISYGGHGGSKRGIIINNERWFLKYPKSTKSMDVEGLSYSTTPLSEYLGSHIYETTGLETHETKLGCANGKIVVACKDFLNSNETIIDYNMIKNEYDENVERAIEHLSSSSNIDSNHDLEEVLLIMEQKYKFNEYGVIVGMNEKPNKDIKSSTEKYVFDKNGVVIDVKEQSEKNNMVDSKYKFDSNGIIIATN